MRVLVICIAVLVTLTGCAGGGLAPGDGISPPKPIEKSRSAGHQGTFKVGNPYRIFGVKYHPRETYSHVETGIASWYGPNFHGKKTANGEIFDMYELTAAHRTLQMPSLVRVTNLENGRSLIVRINDRGPFKRGRIIDLSKRGAELLGFKNQGTAKVRVEVLGEESRIIAQAAKRGEDVRGVEIAMNENGSLPKTKTAVRTLTEPAPAPKAANQNTLREVDMVELGPPNVQGHMKAGKFLPDPIVTQRAVRPSDIFVQAGSFSSRANAERLSSTLAAFGKTRIASVDVRGQTFYRVQLGPLSDVRAADALLERLARSGRNDAIIVVD